MNVPCKILGISASLRNARRGRGNKTLITDLNSISSKSELIAYLESQAKIHLQNFVDAGRKENLPFDQMYKKLKRLKGDRGLSNSEVALASALWSSKELGAEISHLSLSEYFTETSEEKNIEELKEKLLDADGLLLASPVYFGDRGSLSQSFINLLRNDKDLGKKMQGKIYAGVTVGAKRNGGQETALIYQLLDMINCDFFGVGNDSETTSQYGGTGYAGDIGSMAKDTYGLDTAMGTGRRITRVTSMMKGIDEIKLKGKHKIVFWILQDRDNYARDYIQNLVNIHRDNLEAEIIDIANQNIIRCIACDFCPTHIDVDEEYRCIIKANRDNMSDLHNLFLNADAIVPVAFSPIDRRGLETNYQRFIERTRYLRRGDYVFSDLLTAPIVIDEIGANENLHIRMMTSMIRHHTILSKPIISYQSKGKELNTEQVLEQFSSFNQQVRKVVIGKLLAYSSDVNHLKYKPVGYVLSAAKDKEDEKLLKRATMIQKRIAITAKMAKERLNIPSEIRSH